MLKDISNMLQKFKFKGATDFEIVGAAQHTPFGEKCGYQNTW